MPTTVTVMMCKRIPGDEIEQEVMASVYDDPDLAIDFFAQHIEKFLQYDFVMTVQETVGEVGDEEMLSEAILTRSLDEAFASITVHTFPDRSRAE